MAVLVAGPLTEEGFAPFGDVLSIPLSPGRRYAEAALSNGRPGARPSLSIVLREAAPPGPVVARIMERHPFSSQSFVPMGPGRFLVMVAPHAPAGGPDMRRARAFVAAPGQGVTYAADVWHHGLTVLGSPLGFGVFMWRDGTQGDEEFAEIAPVSIVIPGSE
jgi:ureidoglycolate lyase